MKFCYTKLALLIFFLCFVYPAPQVSAESQVNEHEKQEEPETAIHITADRMESNQKIKWVEFIGNVMATQDNIVVSADRMKVFYKSGKDSSTKAGAIEKIISQGNVKILFDNKTKTAMADKAVFFADKKILELTGGNPRVFSGKNIVKGKKITLFQDENRSLVEGADKDQVEATVYIKKGDRLK